jgi:hypothetical protein
MSDAAPPAALSANVEALLGSGALLGSYADLPLLPPGTNPRPYLSRNRVAQPFFIAASTGAVLAHLRGAATLHLRGSTATRLSLQAGDLVALPRDVPYRVLPDGECVQLIYRAEPRGRELLLWYCTYCDTRLYPHVVEPARETPQRAYWAVVRAFNGTTDLRHCESCGALHQPVNLTDLRWEEIANGLEGAGAGRLPPAGGRSRSGEGS